MSGNRLIEVKNLTIGYGKGASATNVAESISFDIEEGELTLMLGCNGAGKSTLLKTLTAVQKPIWGSVKICGENISEILPRDLARKVSVVFTDKVMAGGLLVEEVVALGRYPYSDFYGKITENCRYIVEESLSLVGMLHKSKNYLSQLSDGERQKVMIAKALAQQTPIIILDEPTAFLDLPSKIDILYLLQQLARDEGKTIILSTHDIEQSLQIAQKLILFIDGKVKCMPTEQAVESGELAKLFLSRGVEFDKTMGRFIPKKTE